MTDELKHSPDLTPKRALLVFFVYYAVQVIVGAITGLSYVVSRGIQNSQADLPPGIVVLAALLGILIGGVVAFRVARISLPGSIKSGALLAVGWSSAPLRQLLWATLAGLGLAIFYLLAVTPPLSVPHQQWPPLVRAANSEGWPRHGWALLLLLVAPPIEEFVFRGVMLAGFCRSWTPSSSGVLVTVLFVAAHLIGSDANAPALFGVALIGGAALVARISSGSLLPAILIHASYNLGLVVETHLAAN